MKNKKNKVSWHETFLEICDVIAKRSKDQSTQVGSVIVGPDHEIRSVGYNCFARGIDDNKQERQERPEKYFFFEHAERNAIYNAARIGVPLKGCTLYVQWPPCADCARAIIQSGISVVIIKTNKIPGSWHESCQKGMDMFKEARVCVFTFRDGGLLLKKKLEREEK